MFLANTVFKPCLVKVRHDTYQALLPTYALRTSSKAIVEVIEAPGLSRVILQGGPPVAKLRAGRPPQPVVAREIVVVGDRVVSASGDEQLPQYTLRVVRHGVVQRRVAAPVAVVHIRPPPQQKLAKLRVDVLFCRFSNKRQRAEGYKGAHWLFVRWS